MFAYKGLLQTIAILSISIKHTFYLQDSFALQIIEEDEIDLSYLYREYDLQGCQGITLTDGEVLPNATCSTTIGLLILPLPYFCVYLGFNGMLLWCSYPACPAATLWIHLGNCIGWCFGYLIY